VNAPRSIWLLNPYHTGSHRAWAEGYAARSGHRVRILSMDGYFWKWRMQGGALELAAKARALLHTGERPDLLVATSMVNVPAFLALLRRELWDVPVTLYMHENQLTYPPPPGSRPDLTYGMIQHLAMLAADRVFFNSRYHLDSWFDELPRLLKHFPDYTHLETVEAARAKSEVLAVGCELRRLDAETWRRGDWETRRLGDKETSTQVDKQTGRQGDKEAAGLEDQGTESRRGGGPLVLWNQRWEYDKDPGTMLRALHALAEEGLRFRVALAGANFRVTPAAFDEARSRLGDRLEHCGYVESDAGYAALLHRADIVLSTAIHEFFGVSVVEAIYCGCLPVLPRRLSYPELVPAELHGRCLYDGFDDLLAKLRAAIADPAAPAALRESVARFDWSVQAPVYDCRLTTPAPPQGRVDGSGS
jgi:glycosyltransferase involved in cell wall biosynthesis